MGRLSIPFAQFVLSLVMEPQAMPELKRVISLVLAILAGSTLIRLMQRPNRSGHNFDSHLESSHLALQRIDQEPRL